MPQFETRFLFSEHTISSLPLSEKINLVAGQPTATGRIMTLTTSRQPAEIGVVALDLLVLYQKKHLHENTNSTQFQVKTLKLFKMMKT